MVCDYGMSSLGPLTFGKREEQIFLGREIAQHRDYSEDTAIKIDQEIKRFIMEGYQTAKQILEENRETLCRIAEALLEREVLDANEVKMIIQNIPLEEKSDPVVSARPGGSEPQKKKVVQSLSPSVPSLVDKQREKPAPA
jgi:cell division protease FtsH